MAEKVYNNYRIPPLTDNEIVKLLLSNDSTFELHFMQVMCKPLLHKIAWVIFDNKVSVDELVNEFLCVLKNNDWAKLRTFQFQSSLFGWLKIVAVHYFSNNQKRLYPDNLNSNNAKRSVSTLALEEASEEEIRSLLELMTIQQYHDILYMSFVDKRPDKQIEELLCLTETVYNRKKRFAIEHLKASIINAGSYYESLYLRQEESLAGLSKEETSTKEHEIQIVKMDVATLINLMPNDRYRFVIRSLVLEERKRQEVALEMGITIENLDNIKSRALKQLAEIARKEML